MNRVKYTSTSTGTSTLNSIPSGFVDLSQTVNTYGSSDILFIPLLTEMVLTGKWDMGQCMALPLLG